MIRSIFTESQQNWWKDRKNRYRLYHSETERRYGISKTIPRGW